METSPFFFYFNYFSISRLCNEFLFFTLCMCNIKQVEKVFGVSHPDPMEIEKAKKVLKVRTKTCTFFIFIFSCSICDFGSFYHRTMNKRWLMQ